MSSLYLVYRLPAIEFGHFFKANVDKPTPDSCVIIPLSHLSSFFVCSHTSHPLSLKPLFCFLLLFDRWLHWKNEVDIAYQADPRLIVKRNKYSKRNHGTLSLPARVHPESSHNEFHSSDVPAARADQSRDCSTESCNQIKSDWLVTGRD